MRKTPNKEKLMSDSQPVPRKRKVVKKKPAAEAAPLDDDFLDDEPAASSPVDDDLDMPEMPGDHETVDSREVHISDDFDYDVAFNFAFVGIGQGGARVAQTFYRMGYKRVVVIDGAHQDLQDVDEGIKELDLETSGSAKDVAVGAASVADRDEEIWQLLAEGVGVDVDYILCCGCLGGGTGSGAIHKVMEVSKRYVASLGRPARVGAIVSLPTKGEGQRTAANAVAMFEKLMQQSPAPLIVIDNQRIVDLFQVGVTKLYAKCNTQTAKLFHLFNQLAAQRSRLVTFDRAELADLLDRGLVTFGASPIRSAGTGSEVAEAIKRQLSSTALAQVDLKTASGAGGIFVGSEEVLDGIPMDVLDGGFEMLNRQLGDGAVLHRGVYISTSKTLRCLTLIAGLSPPLERLKELGTTGRVPTSTIAEHFGIDNDTRG